MSLYILYGFLIVVSVWDGITYRIPNVLSLLGLVLGFSVSFYDNGLTGLKDSFLSAVICSALFFLIWMILEVTKTRAIGAGDMKLFIVISSFLGVSSTFTIFYYSLIVGSILFLLILSPKKVANMLSSFADFVLYAIPDKKEKKLKKIAFSIPIFISVLVHMYIFI